MQEVRRQDIGNGAFFYLKGIEGFDGVPVVCMDYSQKGYRGSMDLYKESNLPLDYFIENEIFISLDEYYLLQALKDNRLVFNYEDLKQVKFNSLQTLKVLGDKQKKAGYKPIWIMYQFKKEAEANNYKPLLKDFQLMEIYTNYSANWLQSIYYK